MDMNHKAPSAHIKITDDQRLGIQLKKLRKNHNMTQTTLAGIIGVTCQQVQRWEKGAHHVQWFSVIRLCNALNVTPNYFAANDAFSVDTRMQNKLDKIRHILGN